MRKHLQKAIKKAFSIDEIVDIVTEVIGSKLRDKNVRVGYVSGKVTTDGAENILKNLTRLHKFTDKIAKTHGSFIFSAADIFNDEVYWRLNVAKPLHEEDFYVFWRKIISSGITDIYMTPEWEKSTGARDEHEAARKLKITIHYVDF